MIDQWNNVIYLGWWYKSYEAIKFPPFTSPDARHTNWLSSTIIMSDTSAPKAAHCQPTQFRAITPKHKYHMVPWFHTMPVDIMETDVVIPEIYVPMDVIWCDYLPRWAKCKLKARLAPSWLRQAPETRLIYFHDFVMLWLCWIDLWHL